MSKYGCGTVEFMCQKKEVVSFILRRSRDNQILLQFTAGGVGVSDTSTAFDRCKPMRKVASHQIVGSDR